ncbi:MAG: hypothetical protein R2758_16520 [Bacteroidales bacterium]
MKVIYDRDHGMLCINPGSAGRTGIHKVMTMIRFTIDDDRVCDLEVIEFGRRGIIRPVCRNDNRGIARFLIRLTIQV